jgi:hypothetical protein
MIRISENNVKAAARLLKVSGSVRLRFHFGDREVLA